MIAANTPAGGGVAAAAGGLVPSKTSPNGLVINLAPSAVAGRRVKSLKCAVWLAAKLHALVDGVKGSRPPVCWFVTLTYKRVGDWEPLHITQAVDRYRAWCKSIGVPCRYTWVAELQQRGAVHYHLLCWLPPGYRMRHWDKSIRKRLSFWPHGMSNTQECFTGVGYLMKYLSKLGELHRFPKGLRLHGSGGIDHTGRAIRAWHNLPEWAKRSFGVGDLVRKAGRLLVRATGELLDPAYSVSLMPSGLILHQLRELPERFHCGPYSSLNLGANHV